MNQLSAATLEGKPYRSVGPVLAICVVMGAMLISVGALNGGTALAASAWDSLKATIESMLSSTLVMALIMLVLIVTIWQLAHGQGYRNLVVVLGILAVALIGPSLVQTIATATGVPTAMSTPKKLPASVVPPLRP
ncbi:hypothetical protein [Ralstonia pseudosolanacearum]|uniref:EH domain-containing protein n=1 Tax=Ralstonia pseudosolanacearum TaxID=1310165 RepID=A0A454TLP8_9RALS|nr:hypothetical protein [Ralstonia pseudosolanacearum]RNM03037.1 hypothetical protein EGA29_19900 [Ralstonia pseudosolanacearum]